MKKLFYIFIIIFIFAVTSVGCQNQSQTNAANVEPVVKNVKEETLDIMTTNKLIYYMVKDIVKDKHYVDYMFNSETDQWNYTYSDDSIKNISRKDLFIYCGAGFEPWINKYSEKLSKNKLGLINVSRGTKIIPYTEGVKYSGETFKDNPYYWMNIDNYKTALSNITSAVQEKDPQSRDYYNDNFTKCLNEVSIYEKQYKDLSQQLKEYTFVVSDDKLDYFTKYVNLKTVKINNKDLSFKDTDKVIFLYENDRELTDCDTLIKKYKMSPIKITVYNENFKYVDILSYNIQSLKKIIQN